MRSILCIAMNYEGTLVIHNMPHGGGLTACVCVCVYLPEKSNNNIPRSLMFPANLSTWGFDSLTAGE